MRCLYQTCVAAVRIWDDESWEALSTRHIQLAQAAGALNELVLGLSASVVTYVLAANWPWQSR